MTEGRDIESVSGRYALALFELARERGAADAVQKDLEQFHQLLRLSPDLRNFVKSPLLSSAEQIRALEAILALEGIYGLAGNFFKLLASKRRLYAVEDMITAFGRLYDADKGIARAWVMVAHPLSDHQLSALKNQLSAVSDGGNIQVEVKHDPSLLGGMIVQLGSRMVDTSLKTKLNLFRTRMKEVG